jgi:hypothetical protein
VDKYQIAPAYSPLWKKLYSLVQKFVQLEPWQLFENEDVFIVQSPSDNQMHLCSVMGNGGEEFGLNAFRGAQGMMNFAKIVIGNDGRPPERSLIYELDMLSFSLSARDYMEKLDLTVTKKLLLSFPGGRWPFFRSYRPGYIPWYFTENEIVTFCDCLEQTFTLFDGGENSIDTIRNGAPGEFLVRCKENDVWVSRKVQITQLAKEKTPELLLDDVTRQRLLNLPDSGPCEEIDLIHLPKAIGNHEPPYYAVLLIGINETQFANQYGIFPPFTDYFSLSCDALVQSFLSRGAKPRTVLLKNDSAFADVFENIAMQAGICVERRDALQFIGDFQNSMEESL